MKSKTLIIELRGYSGPCPGHHHALKRPVPAPQIHVIEIGLGRILEALHHVEILRIRHFHRPQHHRVHHAEHHRVGADGQG